MHRAQVDLDELVDRRRRIAVRAEHPLRLRVALDEVDELLRPPGLLQVAERLAVHREERARRTVLWAHVRDGRALGDGERGEAVAGELDELVHDALLAEELGEREHEVGRGRADRELALEPDAHDDRPREVRRLAEHRGLGLDAADAPAEHAEAVDHRGVRVGAEERVRHRDAVAHDDDLREPLEVHLVTYPGTGWDDPEGLEGLAGPAEERVALAVALVLALEVALVD